MNIVHSHCCIEWAHCDLVILSAIDYLSSFQFEGIKTNIVLSYGEHMYAFQSGISESSCNVGEFPLLHILANNISFTLAILVSVY